MPIPGIRKNNNHKNHQGERINQTENDNEKDENMSHTSSYESPAVKSTEEGGAGDNNSNNSNIIGSVFNTNEDDLVIVDDIDKTRGYDRINALNSNSIDESKENPSPPYPYLIEIKHLKRRINNVQEISIQTSRDAIASDLTKYQNNVLNATQNCVNEWRSIARHFKTISEGEDDDKSISPALRTEVGLAVFQLIQLSVQSGPLSGGKPGYFKRCGAEVAKVVLDFLEEVVPEHQALGIGCMGFSSKQMDAMEKWMVNARKTVENDQPPSRSVMKKMKKQVQQPKKTKTKTKR